jgi:hypothetical protein
MTILSIIALTAATLMSPPMQLEWATADIQIGAEKPHGEARCGIESSRVLIVIAQQLPTDGMSKAEREEYDALVERIVSEFGDADQRGRAMIMLEYLKLAKSRQRIITQGWVVLDGMPVVLTLVIDQTTGGQFFKIEDEVSGAHVSYSLQPKNEDDFAVIKELIDTMLKTDDPKEKRAIIDEIALVKSGNEATFEVNGEVVYLSTEDPGFRAEALTIFTDLWPSLEPTEGRKRIEKAVPIVWAAIKDSGTFQAFGGHRAWPEAVYPDSVGYDPCLTKAGVRFVNGESGGSSLSLEAPPDEIIEDFFGDEGLPMPDPDLSWKALLKNIR